MLSCAHMQYMKSDQTVTEILTLRDAPSNPTCHSPLCKETGEVRLSTQTSTSGANSAESFKENPETSMKSRKSATTSQLANKNLLKKHEGMNFSRKSPQVLKKLRSTETLPDEESIHL